MYLTGHPLDDFRFEMDYLCKNRVTELADLQAMKGRELLMGGIVNNVIERVSKSGRPWGAFTLNDYSGSFEFRLFGNDYVNLRNYLIENSMPSFRKHLLWYFKSNRLGKNIKEIKKLRQKLVTVVNYSDLEKLFSSIS